jgi:hypothetical protein
MADHNISDTDSGDGGIESAEPPGELGLGGKQASRTAGAPWPPAHTVSDGPERPVRQIPTATGPDGEVEPDRPSRPTRAEGGNGDA